MKHRLTLLSCMWLSLFLHFLLPYAALAEEIGTETNYGLSLFSPPINEPCETMINYDAFYQIDPKENELEELDEIERNIEIIPYCQPETTKKTPKKALFVLINFCIQGKINSKNTPCAALST